MGVKVLRFTGCTVRMLHDRYMETVYPDGGIVPALFVEDVQARETAAAHGYGTDVVQMHKDHDVAHTFLAEVCGQPYSKVLRHVAGGLTVPDDERTAEEGLVLAFQRYVQTGAADPLLAILPGELSELAARFRALRFEDEDA